MKIVSINGSSRCEKGNTNKIIEHVLNYVQSPEVKTFFPFKSNIKHCIDCKKCFETGKCILKDDMQEYIEALSSSDLIILATPIYTNFMTSSLKVVLDRLRPGRKVSIKLIRGVFFLLF